MQQVQGLTNSKANKLPRCACVCVYLFFSILRSASTGPSQYYLSFPTLSMLFITSSAVLGALASLICILKLKHFLFLLVSLKFSFEMCVYVWLGFCCFAVCFCFVLALLLLLWHGFQDRWELVMKLSSYPSWGSLTTDGCSTVLLCTLLSFQPHKSECYVLRVSDFVFRAQTQWRYFLSIRSFCIIIFPIDTLAD